MFGIGKKKIVCRDCGCTKTKKTCKGNVAIELVLWLCFLLPGLLYSLWRQGTYKDVCSDCESESIVPQTTPVGKKLMKEFHSEEKS